MTPTASDVLEAVKKHGLNGAWLPPKKKAKLFKIAKRMGDEIPGGFAEIIRVARDGTDVWPFDQGPWDLRTLARHWEKAQARANDRKSFNPSERDLQSRFNQEET